MAWWQRLWGTLAIVLAFALVLWAVIFSFALYHLPTQATPLETKYIDFDFAAYCFGLVAVAVTCAGVYVSLNLKPISSDLIERVETHLMPKPFSSLSVAEDICAPAAVVPGVNRGPEIKIIYAVARLTRWVTLDDEEKRRLLGADGLGAGMLGFGRPFTKYEEQWDRRIVMVTAILICAIYASVPFLYLLSILPLLVSVLWLLYCLALVEALTCAWLFWRRARYLDEFERHLGGWRANIDNYIVLIEEERVKAQRSPTG